MTYGEKLDRYWLSKIELSPASKFSKQEILQILKGKNLNGASDDNSWTQRRSYFFMAYSFLQMDSTEKLGLFINKKASKFIDELIGAMTPIVGHYHAFKRRIETQISALDNKASIVKQSFSTTAPQLACDLLYLRLAPNERKWQRLAPILADFYAENKDKIAYISNKSCDTKYRKEAEDSQTLAYFYIENI